MLFRPKHGLSRRTFSKILLSSPAISCNIARAQGHVAASFPFSVASGDPLSDRVILWTRLARSAIDPEPLSRTALAVRWLVAEDAALAWPVRSGMAHASPDAGFSVHVDVTGLLPDRVYYYAFFFNGERSPVGRTRTLPAAGAILSDARFAVVSCQNWENGYFDAYRDIVDQDLQFVLHLGDYIYDVTRGGGVRQHDRTALPMTLDDYRARHALYRTDPALLAAHEAHPFILLPDNHDALESAARTPQENQRRAAAYQAWYEFLPVRAAYRRDTGRMQIHRGVALGSLARLNLLDTRQYRDVETICQHESDGNFAYGVYERACSDLSADPARSMLGQEQEAWLTGHLRTTTARWNILVSTVMMSPLHMSHAGEPYRYLGSWDGYGENRKRILDTIQASGTPNPLCLSGDLHSNLIAQVVRNPGDGPDSGILPEFLGTSISSLWPAPLAAPIVQALPKNPHILHYDYQHRGYLLVGMTPRRLTVTTRLMSFVDRSGGKTYTGQTFALVNGDRTIHTL
ncbi:alkaline phosphatase D [Gluconacetobacter liquefaciens]|uniref:Alkaline phosphatase n=1 Tax=Gluconacetobacter liquefaciens TaxID=89584 RepID=A0A370FZ34_GLULI|nr:alkaline phosphatase D family protein [Gluconacetobacter liquefaciens]MBB2187249.1 alkaline phosphatase [Gluconacetobacter liquefaciens]RDI36792.1 alkaline phosphatase D [Gluconacetobacter liquefaciens]GBR08647.1 hypothetical protein AA0522_2257 [Gluconacetobacter liquefaciens NRIC 0522]GEB38883.1 alkaline phosphatase D [Gluconacetobacter liquefaciens]